LEAILSIPRIDGNSRYQLKWALGVLNIQGSGDSSLVMGTERFKNNPN
jgi:hypothetical protein